VILPIVVSGSLVGSRNSDVALCTCTTWPPEIPGLPSGTDTRYLAFSGSCKAAGSAGLGGADGRLFAERLFTRAVDAVAAGSERAAEPADLLAALGPPSSIPNRV
jgi:hypothetical protein